MWPHRLRVQWQWSKDCAEFIDGTMKLAPKDGINANWQAFFFSNFKYPLESVTLNGQPLQRDQYQFWQHPGTINGPAEVSRGWSGPGVVQRMVRHWAVCWAGHTPAKPPHAPFLSLF
jgi:hypothetical protein